MEKRGDVSVPQFSWVEAVCLPSLFNHHPFYNSPQLATAFIFQEPVDAWRTRGLSRPQVSPYALRLLGVCMTPVAKGSRSWSPEPRALDISLHCSEPRVGVRADHVALASFCDILDLSSCRSQERELGKGERKHSCGNPVGGKGPRAGGKVPAYPQAECSQVTRAI